MCFTHRLGALCVLVGLVLIPLLALGAGGEESSPYVEDVRFAIEELGKRCRVFLEAKGINWEKVAKPLLKDAAGVKTGEEHFRVLTRLLSRLQVSTARVTRGKNTRTFPIPKEMRQQTMLPGFFLCEVGKKIYVKAAWEEVQALGLVPGAEIVKLNGVPARKWFNARVGKAHESRGFSTPQVGRQAVCIWGLKDVPGTRLQVVFKDLKRKKRECSIVREKSGPRLVGPAFLPEGLRTHRAVTFGRTEAGWGYIGLRFSEDHMPKELDVALKALEDVPGLILDFRVRNRPDFGWSPETDNEALLGRFIPKGRSIEFNKRYESRGDTPYGGPVVVIVDGLVSGDREVSCGIFKEDGRAYMIGESPTAGCCAETEQIGLPSGMLDLVVSVRSKEQRFNDGRGIEGIGVIPHEVLQYKPKDLASGVDTLIRRAEAILARFPKKKVPYDPESMGWQPPGR